MSRPRWPSRPNLPWSLGPTEDSPYRMARWMGGRGATEEEIIARLREWHTPLLAMNIARAAEYGYRWGSRIRGDQTRNPDVRPVRSWMLRDADQPSAYRYWVDIDFGVNDAGGRDVRTVAVDSARNLTYAEIYAQAESVFTQIATYYERFRETPITDTTIFLVVLATRKS